MTKTYPGIILRVLQGSIAEELELVPGDKILSVNNMPLRDLENYLKENTYIQVYRKCFFNHLYKRTVVF